MQKMQWTRGVKSCSLIVNQSLIHSQIHKRSLIRIPRHVKMSKITRNNKFFQMIFKDIPSNSNILKRISNILEIYNSINKTHNLDSNSSVILLKISISSPLLC
eukprot:NODE_873_length_3373_cov_0.775199.p4 type:complete len:103 gc:universal NODE_873_length_3373_cov_0.775199:1386-1694(+)